MVDCEIMCEFILVQLKLLSIFFFVLLEAVVPCREMPPLSHCYGNDLNVKAVSTKHAARESWELFKVVL